MESLRGFIVDHTYRIIDGQPKVYLFGRLENGDSFLTINDFRPYFYILTSDREKAEAKVTFLAVEDTDMTNFAGEKLTKVTVSEPRIVKDVRKILEAEKIPCFEADIRFTQRFLMDHDILSNVTITGEFKPGSKMPLNRIYENPELSPSEETIPLRVLSLDLEASTANDGDLYSIALVARTFGGKGPELDEVYFLSNRDTHKGKAAEAVVDLDAVVVPDEKTMLEKVSAAIVAYDPDVITGWNVIDFDLAFLKNKYDKHKVPFIWGRTDWPNKMRIETAFYRDSKAEIPGRMVLDGIQLLRSSFIQLDDYKLETVAQEFLGEGKLIHGKNKMQEIIDNYHEHPATLCEYNKKDADLVLRIFEKKELIALTQLRSELVGLPLERVRASIASLDSLYLRELHKQGKVAPSGSFQEKPDGITGGYVMDSVPGIYNWVVVLDFKSLYPSVMRTFNIDPLDHRPDCKARGDEELIKAPNDTCFVSRDGILPSLLQRIWEQRDEAKKRKDAVASLAFKTLMNSFFGVMASPNCRFFSMDLANGITHFARHFIQVIIDKVEQKGFQVIYGDTDSIFVNLDVDSQDEAEKIATEIQDEMNVFLDEHIRKEYDRRSFLELEFEKTYKKFLMPKVRGRETGSKKRYAGLMVWDGKEKMDFTGLEFVRRDWTALSKEFQLTLYDKIFHDEAVEEYVKQFVKDLQAGKYDELLVYKKAVRKDLASYVKTTPPHIKAARIQVEKEGKLRSNIMEYVITEHGPEPVDHQSASLDYDHYLDKQVRPIADAILVFFNTNLDELMKGTSQMTLGGF